MKLVKEPLIHFLAAGALLFGAYAWLERDREPVATAEPVRITDGDVRWLVETWRRQWLREPGPEEVRSMIADLVEEELLAREAQEMGLAEGDTVVRRRLAQKLTFLIEDTSRLAEPTAAELRAYYAEHADRFRTGATVSFTQVFFNPTGRADAEADARTTLVALGGDETAGASLGDRFLANSAFRDLDQTAVAALFGPDFAEAVFALEPGAWRGPVASGYGQHLVFVSAVKAGVAQPFEAVRDAVARAWWQEKEEAARREYMALLRAKYRVEIDENVRTLLLDAGPGDGERR